MSGFSITVLAVGKLRNAHIQALCDQFERRLARYARVRIEEVRDAACEDVSLALKREAAALTKRVEPAANLVVLTREGTVFSSEALSNWLSSEAVAGRSRQTFVIGGPDGLAPSLVARARLSLSLSKMTLTHEFARLLLLEQLYRAMTIMKGEPYHRRPCTSRSKR